MWVKWLYLRKQTEYGFQNMKYKYGIVQDLNWYKNQIPEPFLASAGMQGTNIGR